MADRRRRRRVKSSEDSDELSEGSGDEQDIEKASEAESAGEVREGVVVDSEYESAEEEGSETEQVEEQHNSQQSVINVTAKSPSLEVEDQENTEKTATNVAAKGSSLELDFPEGDQDPNLIDEEGGLEDTADDDVILGEEYIDGDDDEDEEEEDWKEGERQQGDGQESQSQQLKEKVLDDDEDRRNPQYIPKKGGFYEHDDRLASGDEKEDEKKPKKKLWKDEGKWIHDRFKEDEQRPKSREELIAIYGYDIRNEDGPPRARRRRRYGRGPNKYTRKWEDEDAYGKTLQRRRGTPDIIRRGRGGSGRGTRISFGSSISRPLRQDFRPFSNNQDDRSVEESDDNKLSVHSSQSDSEVNEKVEVRESHPSVSESVPHQEPTPSDHLKDIYSEKQTQTEVKRPYVSRGGGRGWRGGGGGGGDRRTFNRGGRREFHRYSNGSSDSSQLVRGMEKLNIRTNDRNENLHKDIRKESILPVQHNSGSSGDGRRQATIPPRLQEAATSANRPKRYSSQRQRNLPEAPSFQPPPPPPPAPPQIPPRFYDPGVEYPVADAGFQPPIYAEAPPATSPPQAAPQLIAPQAFQGYSPAYQETFGMRPLASTPRMFAPVSIAAGQPVMPTPYIAPSNNLINYGPPPANYTPYTFQQFASPPPPQPVSQPQEIFRGGMAYYNTQNQQLPIRTHIKRPKAAIPILPPPEVEDKKREDYYEEEKPDKSEVTLAAPVEENHESPPVLVEG